MMHTIHFPRFRAGYLVAACCVAIAATCGYQAPRLMQTVLVVGANAQLPLERLAANGEIFTAVSTPEASERAPVRARPAIQKLDDSRRRGRAAGERHGMHGDERSVTGYEYWT